MSTISSKREKRQGFLNPNLALLSTMLIGILVVSGTFTGDTFNSLPDALETRGNATGGISSSDDVSFASDEQYWDANCSHGWSTDPMCDDIVYRAQACEIDTASTYCSDYAIYLQQFFSQKQSCNNQRKISGHLENPEIFLLTRDSY